MLKPWNTLPAWMRKPEVKKYYDILADRKADLRLKRIFDVTAAVILLFLLSPVMVIIAVGIIFDSPGGVLYRQVRVTAYGQKFRIHKFRTMVAGADRKGAKITAGQDARVTNIGRVLRQYRLDEIPQLIDVLAGNMSFVGTRPEVPRYVKLYTPVMRATLLLPAGITSEASIRYKDEADLLDSAEDVDKVYAEKILPAKMAYNLKSIKTFSFRKEIRTMFRTVAAVLGKEYADNRSK